LLYKVTTMNEFYADDSSHVAAPPYKAITFPQTDWPHSRGTTALPKVFVRTDECNFKILAVFTST